MHTLLLLFQMSIFSTIKQAWNDQYPTTVQRENMKYNPVILDLQCLKINIWGELIYQSTQEILHNLVNLVTLRVQHELKSNYFSACLNLCLERLINAISEHCNRLYKFQLFISSRLPLNLQNKKITEWHYKLVLAFWHSPAIRCF